MDGRDSRHTAGKRRREAEAQGSGEYARNSKWRRRAGDGGGDRDGIRRWVSSAREFSSLKGTFVIVSYNILGVENASKHMDLYNQITSKYLSWDWRKLQLRKELIRYCPSILCFQEVDRFEDLADLLREDGYSGIYKGRTGEASDGCAVFWKEERFSLLHHEAIEFREHGLRDNVAQFCLLKMSCDETNGSETEDGNCSTTNRTLLIGNIHVLFNPNRGDIKLGQTRMLLERASLLSKQYDNAAVVIAGDLNSIPKSAIYKFIASPEINILEYDRKEMSGQLEFSMKTRGYANNNRIIRIAKCMSRQIKYQWSKEEIRLATGSEECTVLQNPLQLFSAYQGIPGNHNTRDSNGEPLVTSFHSKFMGTVDYIWHSSTIVPIGVVDTLPVNNLKRLGGLPSKEWGSDHLALVCKFAFNDEAS